MERDSGPINMTVREYEALRTRVAELEKAMGKFLDRDCAIVERDITMRFESHDQACTSLREMLAAIIAVEATE